MKAHAKAVAVVALCGLMPFSVTLFAQTSAQARPAKASPPAPLQKATVVGTVSSASNYAVVPKKPVVYTAVAPHVPIPTGNGSLNPQPIPPGHGANDPVR